MLLSGKEDGIGVESLRYAGMIAGETSQAYKEVVTINLVSNLYLFGVLRLFSNNLMCILITVPHRHKICLSHYTENR